jgi:lambda family phage portal protein
VFEQIRSRLARWIAPARTGVRMYNAARHSRLTVGFGSSNASADGELASGLAVMRARSRALVRDAAYAKRAKVVVVNNVIGSGVGLQAQVMSTRETLRTDVNDAIERAWCEWARAENCHTGGTLHFSDLERMAIGQVFEAGEVFIRKHYTRFGDSQVPFALEVIEPERMADNLQTSPASSISGIFRLGVECDAYYRPVAYWIRERHPGEQWLGFRGTDRVERVPADQIIHLRIVDRWPQTRGEPWLHAAIRKLNDMDGYSEAEIVAARGAASYMAAIESPEGESPLAETQTDGSKELIFEPGQVLQLANGEKVVFHSPNRPNPAMDPFMRMMLREVAAGVGVSYESLSRDYAQSNYSSSRLAVIDDRDLWRTLQLWFIRSFREVIHGEWLQQAVLARAIKEIPLVEYVTEPAKFAAARFKPRGWTWIAPEKEVDSRLEAVRGGFTTLGDVIAETGNGDDLEDLLKRRKREVEMIEEAGLEFSTDPGADKPAPTPRAPAKLPPAEDDDATDDPPRRVVSLAR